MPIVIAPLLGFAMGVAFAWASAKELNIDRTLALRTRGWIVTWLFSGLVYAPICLYFAVSYSDWSWLYLVDPVGVPSAVTMGLVLLDLLSIPAGFLVAAPWAYQLRFKKVLAAGSPPVLVSLLLLTSLFHRVATSATYNQFHGNFGIRSLTGTPLGYALVWMLSVLGIGMVLTWRHMRQLAIQAVQARADHG